MSQPEQDTLVDDLEDDADGASEPARVPDVDDGPELYETVGPHDKSNAMPEPIVDKIRSYDGPDVDDDGTPVDGIWADHTLPEMKLPGFGGLYRDDCGDDIIHGCGDCGKTVAVGNTCGTSTCSRCASTWCRNRATDWTARLKQLKGLRYAITGEDQFFHHLAISPPDMWASDADEKDPRKAGRAIVRKIMDELGVEGVAIYHPYRGEDEDPAEDAPHPVEKYDYDADGPAANDDRGEWKERVLQGRDWDDVRDELKFDPHWHVVCTGGFVRGGQLTKAVEDATDWVIHRITPDDPNQTHSIAGERALARVLAYVYSHAGIRETEHNHRVESTHTGDNLTDEDFEVSDEVEHRADELVREEAWRVLGIPSATMTCHEDHLQPPEDDEEDDVGAGDGDDDGGKGDEYWTTCGGPLVSIDEYDDEEDDLYWRARLEDDDWREEARFDSEVARALAEWLQDQQPDRPIVDVVEAG